MELPEWLPLEVVVKLTARFETILLGQIKRMLKRHKWHEIHPSGQSGDGVSSDSEDGGDDIAETLKHRCRKKPRNRFKFR